MTVDLGGYFAEVSAGLVLDDMKLLGVLQQEDATSTLKAMTGKSLQQASQLSEANYRKALYRTEAAAMVRRVPGVEPYRVYLTQWGQVALQTVQL